MNTTLRSNTAEAEISTLGAELVSFRRTDTDTQYMWSGDAAYWTGRSPVLFPIIGAARGGEIRVDGKSYKIGNHGFARRSEFTLAEASDSRAVFRLTCSDTTLASYPFKFNLVLTYTLNGNTLEIGYQVENTDDREIFFQLGTHPAFNCPIDGGAFSDYELEFAEEETLERLFLNDDGLVIAGKSTTVLQEGRILPLSHEMFLEGALVFRNVNSRRVTLRSSASDKSVAVSFNNFPDLGIWQPKNAPFVCIEPWHGIADGAAFEGELRDKEAVITLAPEAQFNSSLIIEFK